jgi:hypothetical protein
LPVVSAERTEAMLALLADGEPGRRLEIGERVTVRVTRTGMVCLSDADRADTEPAPVIDGAERGTSE